MICTSVSLSQCGIKRVPRAGWGVVDRLTPVFLSLSTVEMVSQAVDHLRLKCGQFNPISYCQNSGCDVDAQLDPSSSGQLHPEVKDEEGEGWRMDER